MFTRHLTPMFWKRAYILTVQRRRPVQDVVRRVKCDGRGKKEWGKKRTKTKQTRFSVY